MSLRYVLLAILLIFFSLRKQSTPFYLPLNQVTVTVVSVLLMQVPVGCGKDFSGVVDLVAMEILLWGRENLDGTGFLRHPLERGTGSEGDDYMESFFAKNAGMSMSRSLLEEVRDGRIALIDQVW